MTYKKKASPLTSSGVVNIADKLLKDIDAEVLMVGVLGGMAAAGGITPPLTRILMMMTGNEGSDSIKKDLIDIWALGPFFVGPLWIQQMLSGQANPSTTTALEAQRYAIVASGALEAMLMMTLMKNPATVSALGGVANATITAVGGLVGKIPAAGAAAAVPV